MATTAVPLQAGGGVPSAVSSARTVPKLSEGLLAHLRAGFEQAAKLTSSSSSSSVLAALESIQGEPPLLRGGGGQGRDSNNSGEAGGGYTFHDFLDYVTSPASSALGPPPEKDLDYPISSYFISSSHNTYLTGHQLYGRSSVDGYVNVLHRGCRCIEIDVWDGDDSSSAESNERQPPVATVSADASAIHGQTSSAPEDGTPAQCRHEPQVFHGYTLTKEVSFREVCAAVAEAAFVTRQASPLQAVYCEAPRVQKVLTCASNLPVIVSLECHASLAQQAAMVDIMREVWKGLLLEESVSSEIHRQPTLKELERKILVKVKAAALPKEPDAQQGGGSNNNTLSRPSLQRADSSTTSSSSDDGWPRPKQKKAKKPKMIEALSLLGVYTKSYHFSNFSQPEASVPSHVFSLSEKALQDLREAHSDELFSHNCNFLMRTYPHGLRISSSNLNPLSFWRDGVQMVALNWQKCDKGMMLNEGMFAGEGGWVLKPPGFRGGGGGDGGQLHHDQFRQLSISGGASGAKQVDLAIQIFAAQDVPLPPDEDKADGLRPYVKCNLHVVKCDADDAAAAGLGRSGREAAKQVKKTKSRRGVNPDFGGETLAFSSVANVIEELSFVRLKIHDEKRMAKDPLAAWACLRLDRLRSGYRLVRLLDAQGNGVESRGLLLIRVMKTTRK